MSLPRLVTLLCAAALAVPGCGAAAGISADGGGVQAVATVFPLAWLAEQVAPDAAVTYVGGRGQDPHDLELSPRERALLGQADVVAYVGDIGFQPQIEDAVAAASGEVVSVADAVGEHALLAVDDDDHDDGRIDPHVWFDAGLMAAVTRRLGDAFAAADPARADSYRDNARRVAGQLRDLDAEIARRLDRCRVDKVVVSHEAYAYLLAPHGLEQDGVSSAAGHAAASPGRIAELADEIGEQRLPAVLSEPVEGRGDAEAVAQEAGVDVLDIYSLDIVSDEQSARGYPQLLREQADAVAQAADCRGTNR